MLAIPFLLGVIGWLVADRLGKSSTPSRVAAAMLAAGVPSMVFVWAWTRAPLNLFADDAEGRGWALVMLVFGALCGASAGVCALIPAWFLEWRDGR